MAPAAPASADPLHEWVPEYRLSRHEADPPKRVVYARQVGQWLQYWSYYRYNSQDRGILRTGRHEGDWELVQLHLSGGRPDRAVYAQHAWSEACGVRRRPVVFVANGSHAAYFTAGTHNRPWPDPDDEADGRGTRLRPAVVPITRDSPAWMRRAQPWGGSRAGWFPGEQSSPRGPAFQHNRFDDPAAFAATARACGSGAPGRPALLWGALATVLLLVVTAGIRAYGHRQIKLGS